MCSNFFKPRGERIVVEKRDAELPREIELITEPKAVVVTFENSGYGFISISHLCRMVMFEELCKVFEKIEATTKRLEINEILTAFFVRIMTDNPQDLTTIVHLCLSRVSRLDSVWI
jgi:hypothetical protein